MPKSKRDMSPTALPGFEDTIVPARPGEQDMTDEKAYTGEVLFKRHPDVFRAVAAAPGQHAHSCGIHDRF